MIFEWPLIPVTTILFFTACTVSLFGSASFSMAMTKYGKMAGSASAILGFASMFAAGIVSPIVGLGGEHTGIPMGDYNASMCSAFLIVLVWFSRERIISFKHLCEPDNGPHYNRINFSIKTAVPSSCSVRHYVP